MIYNKTTKKLTNMKLLKSLIFIVIINLFATYSYSQTITVTGKVTDEKGLPFPGVSINIKGTSNGVVIADIDGNYVIKVASNATLQANYIGYITAQETVNNRNKIDFKLSPSTENLNEVVVVGYGTQKKSVVTGSISGVKAKDIENLPITRIEQTLQGRVSGVTIAANAGEPGSPSTIRIRGITSINANEPLWVVDGVIVDSGGIGYLNQSDIESVEVLKDAASQAIYGTRAAAGVILVTTKSGKSGKIKVTYNGYSGISGPARKLKLLNSQQYATLTNEAYTAGYTGSQSDFVLPFDIANIPNLGNGTDWQSVIFNNRAQRQGHDVSISGGNEKSTFYMSFGLLDQEGIVASEISNYNRKNIRLNSTHKIAKWLTFGQTLGFSTEKNVGIGNTNSEFGGPLASAINLDPTTPIIATDPAELADPVYSIPRVLRDGNGNPYGISNLITQEIVNPLAFIQTKLGNYGWADNFVGNAFLEIEPFKGFKFKSNLSGKMAYYGFESFTPESYLNSSSVTLKNNIQRQSNRNFGWSIENTINYTKSIYNHNFSVLLGQGAYIENISSGHGLTYFDIPVTNYRDASFNFNIPDAQKTTYAYTGNEHIVTSVFSRLNYDYKEKYLFTGIIRKDGSSRFGDNKKYGIFPSFSLGWVVSKENFWPKNNFINLLKFKGGFGIVGSDAIGDFRYLATVSGGRNYSIGTNGAVVIGNSPDAPSNPDLQWEETSQANIGFEARLFQNFNLSFDYYNKKTSNILQNVVLPGFIGANGDPAGNVADMENKGYDIEMGYRKKIGGVNFGINANISYLENKVTFLGNGRKFLDGGATIQSGAFPITRVEVGQPFNAFYGFETNGIFQNEAEVTNYVSSNGTIIQPLARPGDFKWKDIDGNGLIDSNDRTFIGSPIPDFTYGMTINLDYKNFDLTVFAQGVTGNQIFQGVRRLDVANSNYQTVAMGRWTGEGTSNTFPRITTLDTNQNFSRPSNFQLQDGDYLRIKTIQLGFSIPKKIIEKSGLQRSRIYLTGENLFTFTKYTGFDPEIGGGVLGIDRGFYPQAKSIMLGVNLEF